jgi:streptomycin 6-kinase
MPTLLFRARRQRLIRKPSEGKRWKLEPRSAPAKTAQSARWPVRVECGGVPKGVPNSAMILVVSKRIQNASLQMTEGASFLYIIASHHGAVSMQ